MNDQAKPDRRLKTITFVLWDEENDGVAIKEDGEVAWREESFDCLDQYLAMAPLGEPVILEVES